MAMKDAWVSRGRLLASYLFLPVSITLLIIACTTQATSTPSAASPTPTLAETAPTETMTTAPLALTATPVPTPIQSAPTAVPALTQAPPPGPTDALGAPADLAADIANFTLPQLTVQTGTTVTWTNRDGVTHTATSGVPGSPDGVWDSSFLSSGNSFSFVFEQPGEFPYFCQIHTSMRGTVTVE